MKRIGRGHGLLSSIPSGIRYNSTESLKQTATIKRTVRLPVARLGDVLIPSAEEIRAKNAAAKPSYTADISYLQNASDNFLSVKLARLGLQETAQQEPPQQGPSVKEPRVPLTPEEVAAITAKRREERQARNIEKMQMRSYVPVPEKAQEVAAITAKRREERQARSIEKLQMRSYNPVPEKAQVLRAEVEKAAAFVSPGRTTENLAAAAAAKRRAERLDRQSQSGVGVEGQESKQRSRPSRPPNRQKERTVTPKNRIRKPQTSLQTVQEQSHFVFDIDEAVFQPGGHEPEYEGPEQLSSNLLDHFGSSFGVGDVTVIAESGKSVKVPISKVDSFVNGDYTPYVNVSAEDFVTSPDVLEAVKVAQRTLSHQRHYSLPARDGIIKVISQFAQPSSNTAAEAR